MELKLKLIIGLGNPDQKYTNTYHNVGFLFIDYAKKFDDRRSRIGMKNNTPIKSINSNISILKSSVHMNESGKFVSKELKKAGEKPEELLIVHDDSDLLLGTYKLQFGRGAAGHHGVENVQAALKTKNFWRLRIGIRPTNEKVRQKAEKFVLKKITIANKKILEKVFEETITHKI